MTWPTKMLMVNPEFFTVEYAINPHMLDDQGQLQKVDTQKACQQWQQVQAQFEATGMTVEVIDGHQGLPDMVFCANQIFPFIKDGELKIVLSQMNSEQRQPEVAHFKDWADKNNIETFQVDSAFEGMGDALWNYETGKIYGGYGFRTRPDVYSAIEKWVGQKITTFELKDERFYHLDTCLSILNATTAAYVEEAFTQEGLATLKSHFSQLIPIPLQEATTQLACNMCTPNGKDVILQEGAEQTNQMLEQAGFNVHPVDTSEFLKSGGSVFCMKMLLPQ